jgi:transcriptional regulator with XRE-family HTH domain
MLPVIDMQETGKNITMLRKRNNFTVRELQTVFGFSTPQAIYKWQNGSTLPMVDNLLVLSVLFHVKIEDILVVKE